MKGISLNADGSASFAGDVKIGGLPSDPNISLKASGSCTLKRQTPGSSFGDGTLMVFNTQGSTSGSMGEAGEAFARFRKYDAAGNLTDVAGIASDGSATFAGSVESTGGSINASAFYVGLPANNATRFSTASNGSTSSALYIGNARILTDKVPTIRFELEADDDTKYTATTDADGNQTLVYNGAVLDVKDRLTKLDTALTGLKSALVSTTDHASLKAALITALADI